MNRPLEFRVWTGTKMEYNIVAGRDGVFYAKIHPKDSACLEPTSKYELDTPVMQFTGLRDIFGVKIFEGDIIQHEGAPYKYEVVWNRWQWGIDSKGIVADFIQGFTSAVEDRAIVIGNIFETPNLI